MLKNYLKIAIRNLLKNKSLSLINIFGLSLGMAFCLIMLMYVVNELSYDNYHAKKDRIYRVAMEWGQEGKRTNFGGIFPAIGPALTEQFPEVEKSVRLEKDTRPTFKVNNTEYSEDLILVAEQSIFDIFSFEVIQGDKNNLLSEPNTAVLSESIAKKYFGNDPPLGKTLLYENQLIKVSGIIKDMPKNSHLKTDVLISYRTLKSLGKETDQPWNSWGSTFTYFLLREGNSISGIPAKLTELLSKNGGEFMGKSSNFVIQKISDIHFITDFRPDIGPKGNLLYLYIFLSASILILLLGCFNYVNLTISLYLNRMSEVGIRKVFGARRIQLIRQFLIDSLIITFISMIFGILCFEILYREVFNYLGTKVILSDSHIKYFFAIILGIVLIVGIISGGYPALFLSRCKPVDIVRKKLSRESGNVNFRKVIVVLQFAITIILIIGSIVIYRQVSFMKNSDLGFEKENVAILNFREDQDPEIKYQTLCNELKKHSSIIAVSGGFLVPGSPSSSNISIQKKNGNATYFLSNVAADFDYVKSLGLKIIQGRDYSANYPTDASESVLLNEAAVQEMDLKNPIGEQLVIPTGSMINPVLKTVNVIGVVKDFHVRSKHQKIAPMIIRITPNYILLAIRMAPGNTLAAVQHVKETWKKLLPDSPLNINYLDDLVDRMYLAEDKINNFISGFALMAVIISCLGLFGLTKFIVSRRIKEVGIRKVLGASLKSLVFLLSKQFILWVLLANIIAWPVTYYLIDKWMSNFAYRIGNDFLVFVLAGLLTLAIAISTLSYVVIRTANTNPINSLRYE